MFSIGFIGNMFLFKLSFHNFILIKIVQPVFVFIVKKTNEYNIFFYFKLGV